MNEGAASSSPTPGSAEDPAARFFAEEIGSKYEFRRLLGRGGMGHVVLAKHRHLGELVAIKLLNPGLANAGFPCRFKREARAAARLRSAHVARVMDVGELVSGAPYIVMEYLEGEDLARRLATGGRLPPDVAVHYLLQALDAIAEAHDVGIVHRDIKPANLFLTSDREGRDFVKVLDFGLAKSDRAVDTVSSVVTEPGTLVGSPCYMPPEQLLDARNTDSRSDVWALGATLFELIVGMPPFTAPTMPQLYTAIVHGRIRRAREAVPECPESVDDVVARCLTRNPEGRFENARALRDALLAASPDAAAHASLQETRRSRSPAESAAPLSPTSITPVASSWSPDERLAQLVRRNVVSRRSLGLILLALAAASIGLVGARRASTAAVASTHPTTPVRATPSAASETAAPSAAPAEAPSAPEIPPRVKTAKSRAPRVAPVPEPRDEPGAAPSVEPPSVYDKYP